MLLAAAGLPAQEVADSVRTDSVAPVPACTLSGRVVDDDGEGIAMAIVKVEGHAVGTMANLEGRYSLALPQADSLRVSYSMMGYETKTKLFVRPAGRLVWHVTLHTSGHEMSEVVVSEMRRQLGSTQELQSEALSRMPSTSGNAVEELVATQAGVSTHNELSSQYNVRGGSFDENCVYINGVEVYRPLLISSGQQEGLSVINSDMVERIQFSAGGFEAKYGDRMASVLDITYRRPERHEGTFAASMLGASLFDGLRQGRLSLSQGLRYKTNRYLLGSLETTGEYAPTFLDYQAYLSWTPSARWTLDAIGYISANNYRFRPHDRETNFGTMQDVKHFRVYFDGEEQDLFRTMFAAASVARHFGPRTQLTLGAAAFGTRERETYDIQGQYWLDETGTSQQLGVGTYMEHARNLLTSHTQTLRLGFEHRTTAHHIQLGASLRAESIRENTREWEYRDSAGYSMPHHTDRLEVIYNLKSVQSISSTRSELYAQDTWRHESHLGTWSLNYGARLSHWSWTRETLFSPRASLGFVPAADDSWTLRLATGMYYQAPFYKELRDTTTTDGITTVVLNRDLRSQRSWQVVAAAERKFRMAGRPFKATAEVYYKAQSRLNPYNVDGVKVVYYGRNEGSGYVAGIDMKVYGEFVPGTDSWVSLSLMRAKMTLHGKSIPQPTDQRWNLNLFFSDYFPNSERWRMTLKMAFAAGLPFGSPHAGLERNVFRAPAYRRVDLGMSHLLLDNTNRHIRSGLGRSVRTVWLGLDCFNLLGISNVASYLWITDIQRNQYAVPNYLTGRQLNARLLVEF